MSGFRVDIPDHVEPHVSWTWIRMGEYLVVSCDNCGAALAQSAVSLSTKPRWLVAAVEQHNACEPGPGALDPWTPGTP